jgi:Na+/melibiose symporter-like transporter
MTKASAPYDSQQIFLYFSSLTLLVFLVLPEFQLLDIPTSYMLKNQLHATATQISTFRLLTALPVYLAFLFGLMRDLWNPFGWRDRGIFLIFAPLTAVVFVWMALSRLSFPGLITGMLLVMLSSRFILGAYSGLIALVAQEKLMSGRLSALWNTFQYLPMAVAAAGSGLIAEYLSPKQTFLLATALTLLIGMFAFWEPHSVFGHTYDRPEARGLDLVGDIKRLIKHRPLYPAVLLNLMWYFTPGQNTPLQFYLTNQLHASDAVYSYYFGIFLASMVPIYFLYGILCRKVSLHKLIWWGTIIGIPQMVPLAFIHSGNQAMLLAVPLGMTGGLATASYLDLAMRSCPPGLQGTLMMLVGGMIALSLRGSDLLGSWIYGISSTHGFIYCVIASCTVYILLVPVLLLIPKQLIATTDGEETPSNPR